MAFVNLPVEDADVKFLDTVSHLSDIFVAGKKYEYLKGEEIGLNNLQEFPLLMMERNTVAINSLNAFLALHGVTLTPDIEVSNWDLMVRLAVKGMGLGCIPREYCVEELANGQLFEVP